MSWLRQLEHVSLQVVDEILHETALALRLLAHRESSPEAAEALERSQGLAGKLKVC